MKVLELFSGTGVISEHFRARGHETFTVDFSERVTCDLHMDIEFLTFQDVMCRFGRPDVIWASPDCTSYSVAALGKHRCRQIDSTLAPVTDYARKCDSVNAHVIDLITALDPEVYFIENPRGGLRKMHFMLDLPRYTVTYCQYGETRMKPTDIWTNHPNPKFKPPCKNGDPCHERAPRGSRTGTQGICGKLERAKIPDELCNHIVDICEELICNGASKTCK